MVTPFFSAYPAIFFKAITEFSVAWDKVSRVAGTSYLKSGVPKEVVDFVISTDMPDFTCYTASTDAIERLTLEAFEQCPAIEKWNDPKDSDAQRGDPDRDFISLGALARNVAHLVTLDWQYSNAKDLNRQAAAKAAREELQAKGGAE